MDLQRVLLVYKKSIYQIYFKEHQQAVAAANVFSKKDVQEFKKTNYVHLETLSTVRSVLAKHGIAFREVYRARQVDPSDYDLVISVGGDGTFLEAARRLTTQTILGVNSDTNHSVGHFCPCSKESFEALLQKVRGGTAKARRMNRLCLTVNNEPLKFHILNDLLIAHAHPGAMSRYSLQVDALKEDQKGSGIWISTAAGSTGGIAAAGGKVMKLGSKKLQYLPRELFRNAEVNYKLRGGVLPNDSMIHIRSLMREGIIYVDGAHLRIGFPYGTRIEIGASPYPLRTIVG